MEITRNNYETFFLDYLEGNLDDSLVNEFIEFLQQNPDLKKELENFKAITLNPTEVSFLKKKNLYKEKYDSGSVFNNASVGYLENDLSETEKSELEKYLDTHPEKQKDFELFQKTKLVADNKVLFKKKSSLKKSTPFQKIRTFTIRIAAILILVFAVSVLIRQYSEIEVPPPQLVQVEKNASVTEPEVPKKLKTVSRKETEKIQVQPIIKDTIKAAPVKSIRENMKGRADENGFAQIQRDTLIMNTIGMKNIQIASVEPETILAGFDLMPQPMVDDYLLADGNNLIGEKIKEKAGLNKFRLNDITKAGLKFFSNISGNKFTYGTNNKGDITELNFDTRLLAFSIPTRGNPE